MATPPKPPVRSRGPETPSIPQSVFLFRQLERMAVAVGGILTILLGFFLFIRGLGQGGVNVSFIGVVLNGQGPGLAFMAMGVWLLNRCLKTEMKVTIDHKLDGKPIGESTVIVLGKPVSGPDGMPDGGQPPPSTPPDSERPAVKSPE